MGGRSKPWGHGEGRSGITYRNGNPVPATVFDNHVAFNDGKLEFATFSTMFGLMFQRTNRIYQSDGTFTFKFNEVIGEETPITYINIDGEFYQLYGLKEIIIRKAEDYAPDGKIKILVNDKKTIFD